MVHVKVTLLVHVKVTLLVHVKVTLLVHVKVTLLVHVKVTLLVHVKVTILVHVKVTLLAHVKVTLDNTYWSFKYYTVYFILLHSIAPWGHGCTTKSLQAIFYPRPSFLSPSIRYLFS
jgi:hypothetical protein